MLATVPTARTSPWALGTAALINGSLLALLLSMSLRTITYSGPKQPHRTFIPVDALSIFAPHSASGGQGGGQNNLVEASRGRLPQIERKPLAPPQVPNLDHPKLAIDNAMRAPQYLKLPDDPSLTTIGLPRSANVTVVSGGRGAHGGIGDGDDGGVGNGHGIGFGPGTGDGIYIPGGEVSAPVPIFAPEAEFSDEARRQKHQGICIVSVTIDAHGRPRNPRVVRHLGMGLDEKALDVISRYRFKPARRLGVPVAVQISVAVDFRLY